MPSKRDTINGLRKISSGHLSARPGDVYCLECGEPMTITDSGIAHHIGDSLDGIDYARDRDHVAIADVPI